VGNNEFKKGTLINLKQRVEIIVILQEYADVYACSYEDMSDLDTNIIVHKIPLEEGCKPIKQKLKRVHPDI